VEAYLGLVGDDRDRPGGLTLLTADCLGGLCVSLAHFVPPSINAHVDRSRRSAM
jgi:hypothetical protein